MTETQQNKLSNAKRFLNAFASIEEDMRIIMDSAEYTTFGKSIEYCSEKNPVIRENSRMLNEYRQLRNAMVHQRDESADTLADPIDSTVADIERIAAALKKPATASEYASSPVYTVASEDTIEAAFAKLKEQNIYKVPVYDDGHYVGLLTSEAYVRWVFSGADPANGKVKDVLAYTEKVDEVKFMRKDAPVGDVLRAFDQTMSTGTTLRAILLNEDGSGEKVPESIITVKDLPKILNALHSAS